MRRLTETEAIAVMRAAGYEPLEPYPGAAAALWRCRCTGCGNERTPRLNNAHAGRGCKICADVKRAAEQRAARAPAAIADVRAAGYEPQESFPGTYKPWACVHTACGTPCTVELRKLRKRGPRKCATCKAAPRIKTGATGAQDGRRRRKPRGTSSVHLSAVDSGSAGQEPEAAPASAARAAA